MYYDLLLLYYFGAILNLRPFWILFVHMLLFPLSHGSLGILIEGIFKTTGHILVLICCLVALSQSTEFQENNKSCSDWLTNHVIRFTQNTFASDPWDHHYAPPHLDQSPARLFVQFSLSKFCRNKIAMQRIVATVCGRHNAIDLLIGTGLYSVQSGFICIHYCLW